MEERELLTIGLGNYATLVAAQWANGTTRYDTTHRTLYTERRADRVLGGNVSSARNGSVMRVPRLVLLDAPHATRMKNVPLSMDWERLSTTDAVSAGEEEPFTPITPPSSSSSSSSSSSFSFSSSVSSSHAGDEWVAVSEENALGFVHSHRDPCRDTFPVTPSHAVPTPSPNSHGDNRPRCGKRRLFQEFDALVPWWRYIATGVGDDAVHTLRPLHHTPAETSVLRSFGFGHAALCASRNPDIAALMESLRRQLEDADMTQGVQCFVDAYSAFGGAACNVLRDLWEEAGAKLPAVLFACDAETPVVGKDTTHRQKDTHRLNRLLAMSHLTRAEAAVCVPIHTPVWSTSFAPAEWRTRDVATAQCVAAVADTALYGVRDGEIGGRPSFHLRDWTAAVRPTVAMRVAAAHVAIPMRVHQNPSCGAPVDADLWDLMRRYPLLPFPTHGEGGGVGFVPLTHETCVSPMEEAGRVLGHAVSLRGAGVLLDRTYPRQEALWRYGLPMRSSDYLPFVTSHSYPISSSFPEDFVVPNALLGSIDGIDVGTHVVSTFGSAPMLRGVIDDAQHVLQRRRHLYDDLYQMEKDEWVEVTEEVKQIYDDYNHADMDDDEGMD